MEHVNSVKKYSKEIVGILSDPNKFIRYIDVGGSKIIYTEDIFDSKKVEIVGEVLQGPYASLSGRPGDSEIIVGDIDDDFRNKVINEMNRS